MHSYCANRAYPRAGARDPPVCFRIADRIENKRENPAVVDPIVGLIGVMCAVKVAGVEVLPTRPIDQHRHAEGFP